MEKIQLLRILKLLVSNGIDAKMSYDAISNQFFIDFNTRDLILWEDGRLCGRYNYETIVDFDTNDHILIETFCRAFQYSLHGRDYGNLDWFALCRKYNINND